MLEHGAWEKEKKRDEVLKLAVSQRVACIVEVAGACPPPKDTVENAGPSLALEVTTGASNSALEDVQTKEEFDGVHGQLKRDLVKAIKFADIIKINALLE